MRETFIENFDKRNELGAACCIYYRGERVVDLWGGIRNKATGEPWEENTMALVYSTTKGLAGLAMALAHSRGLFDYEERVSKYWPEFAQQGKEKVTVRQLLSHQAGLYASDVPVEKSLAVDLDRLAVVLARQKPAWEPGTRQAYHAITLGFYESELLRRVDPRHRTLGQFFQDEIASPLSLDVYIRLPEEIPSSRLAVLRSLGLGSMISMIFTTPPLFALAAMNPHSRIRRALDGSMLPLENGERVYARNLEIPSGGAVASASGIAQAYSVFATGGHELGLREETLKKLMAPAVAPVHGFHDECLKVDVCFSLGFMKPSPSNSFGHPSSFGAPGSGGSFGFADPQARIGYAYVPNQMGAHLQDPRDMALRTAMYRSIGETRLPKIHGPEERALFITTSDVSG
ncbi:MAG: serine hydrolase domain-containing protein [Candidatus Dormiibacterota bacterium]